MALSWTTLEGASGGLQVVDGARVQDVPWIALSYGSDLTPVVTVGAGEVQSASVSGTRLTRLGLEVAFQGGPTLRRVVFDRSRVDGRAGPQAEDVYVVTIAPGLAAGLAGPTGPAAVARLAGVARRYLAQAEAGDEELAACYAVTTARALPRVVVTAEEWFPLPAAKKRRRSPLGALTRALDGKTGRAKAGPAPVRKVPGTSIDVLLDRLEARGEEAYAFQTARSIWSDVLEAKVIHEVTGRRALSATVVFAQSARLANEQGEPLETVVVDAGSLDRLTTCRDLPASTAEDVREFLTEVPGGRAILPVAPVPFFDAGRREPAFAVYAWFQVDPASGRWVGRTADSLHGGMSEVGARVAQRALTRFRKRGKSELNKRSGPALRAFFGAVSGLYVASAGVLDAVTITVADPDAVALSGKSWTEFVALHALDHATTFLRQHADIYDDVASRAGYWGGVAAIVGNLGGEAALRQTAGRAVNDLAQQVRKLAEKKLLQTGVQAGLQVGYEREASQIYEGVKWYGVKNLPQDAQTLGALGSWLANTVRGSSGPVSAGG